MQLLLNCITEINFKQLDLYLKIDLTVIFPFLFAASLAAKANSKGSLIILSSLASFL